jgi:hypothetical protein
MTDIIKQPTFKFETEKEELEHFFSVALQYIEERYTSPFIRKALLRVVKGIKIRVLEINEEHNGVNNESSNIL